MKINFNSKETIFEQIVNQIIEYISLGIYKPSDKLPSVRELSSELNVNPNTIQKAYRELENNGFIYSIAAKGNYVSQLNESSQKVTMKKLKRTIRQVVIQSHYLEINEIDLNTMIREEFERERENCD